jgi:hypothetical protein
MQGRESARSGNPARLSRVERIIGTGSALVLLATFLGCMSFSIGGGNTEIRDSSDGTLKQSGSAKVPGDGELDVYFPTPYTSNPNLETGDDFDHCVVVQQYPDHFRVKNSSALAEDVKWTARGVRAVASAPANPPPQLPAEPAPIGTSH